MINNKKVLGLVLAREGSKGFPGKNIKIINGKPLIAWSILAGLDSRYIDDVLVSTDGEEIALVAKEYGAEVPFKRPSELASDKSTSFDAIIHAINWLESKERIYDIIILLEPTSPLREAEDIDLALEFMTLGEYPTVVSICKAESVNPAFMYKIDRSGKIFPFTGNYPNNLRRQDIDSAYFIDGTLYCSNISTLLEKKGFYHEDTYGFVIPKWKGFEIDDETDFVIVEALFRHKLEKK